MSNNQQIETLIAKIEELRLLFQSTAEAMPFIKDLFQFLKDLMPLMTEANLSLMEGAQNIPTASNRISDVNQTTEMATQTILDKLDVISSRIDRLAQAVPSNLQTEVEEIQNEISHIIYALQFQDITAQKLEHANRILQAIYAKFVGVFKKAEAIRTSSQVGEKLINDLNQNVQDEEVKVIRQQLHQTIADTVRHEGISQDDIDKIFK